MTEQTELGSSFCYTKKTEMITLAEIKHHPDVVEALDWPFDFSLSRAENDADWITLKPPFTFHVIAGEGAGGAFIAYGEGETESLPILHATSEGQAGKVASNLTEWLGILISIPFWKGLLKFSGNGQIDEMRLTATFMEREYEEDYPDLPKARETILAKLPIPQIIDPIQTLHGNVHASDCTLIADDGWAWESLFNKFTAADNRNWTTKA
jgi:hypothetical protein